MSLKNILDNFKEGRAHSKEIFEEDKETFDEVRASPPIKTDDLAYTDLSPANLQTPQENISLYSRAEQVSYAIGFLSRPKAAYEIAKFFLSGRWKGGQGISQEELVDYQDK